MTTEAANCSFSAELSFVPCFNLALQQNALPVIHSLKLINNTGETFEDLQCRFFSVPEFIHEKTIPVAGIKAGETLSLDQLEIELDYNLLSQLSERVKGTLHLEISTGSRILLQKEFECEAFAPDQWHSMTVMP